MKSLVVKNWFCICRSGIFHQPVLAFIALASLRLAAAPTPLDEESPWPRVRSTNGNTVTLHLPQVEHWTSNSFTARAAVEVKPAGAKTEALGVVWFEAHGKVDRQNRLVTLDHLEITKSRFPGTAGQGSNAVAVVRQVLPAGARTVSLDYLITALGFAQAAARQGPRGLLHTPPEIIWATNRAVLIRVDGEPVLRPIPGAGLERVINTPALLVRDPAQGKFYLNGQGHWFAAGSIKGSWSLSQDPPAEVTALAAAQTNAPLADGDQPAPRIIIRTSPSELISTAGLPDFRPIRGTALQYAADTDSQLFFHTAERQAYLLLSGRWLKASSLSGPWTHVAPHDLPADFAKIPPGTPQAVVLASVPDTPQAELALLANSVPTTATISRREATLQVLYDGEPQFKPIEGTSMAYAANSQLPVIHAGSDYYAVDDGVWFKASTPTGPWQVAAEVPEEIYTIPPSSPVYYSTFARVYDSSDDEVEVGYTPGYQGAYEDDGTMVYGTGWDYAPWYGNDYYGWGWTWGYGYVYVPWYQWWLWRPWWNQPGGLRAALIENIYDRWQDRPGVIHHDRPLAQNATSRPRASFSGHPALYGRFKGSTRPEPLALPPNTLAINPYSRPSTAARSGDIPRGAQLLSTVRQAPGAGQDLYASPDGNVYRRKNDAWYRREANGAWGFFAPTQGRVEGDRLASAQSIQSSGMSGVAGSAIKPSGAGARREALSNRVPDTGKVAQAQEVAELERQYYARAMAQMQAGNRRAFSSNRQGRIGGRR
jgi:hypothetical protein